MAAHDPFTVAVVTRGDDALALSLERSTEELELRRGLLRLLRGEGALTIRTEKMAEPAPPLPPAGEPVSKRLSGCDVYSPPRIICQSRSARGPAEVGTKPAGIIPVHRPEFGKRQEQARDVIRGTVVNDIEILRVHGYALQDGRNASHDDEANSVSIENFNQS